MPENILSLSLNFTEICSLGFNWQEVRTGLGNDFAPIRDHAINWINDDIFLAYICVFMLSTQRA